MSTEQSTVSTISKDTKHPYIPLTARKVQRGSNYASTIVSDQKTMMENLRFLRHQMDKEERQLKIMSDALYKRSMPHRESDFNRKHAVTSLEHLPLPPPPAPLISSPRGKPSIKPIKTDLQLVKKTAAPLYKYQTAIETRKPAKIEKLLAIKPSTSNHRVLEPNTNSWSKEAEARWLQRYQRFLVANPSIGGTTPSSGGLVTSSEYPPIIKPVTRQVTPYNGRPVIPVLNDRLEEICYEKNGRRFSNYSGLGEDGWILEAVDRFYDNRFGSGY